MKFNSGHGASLEMVLCETLNINMRDSAPEICNGEALKNQRRVFVLIYENLQDATREGGSGAR
jgi:hypothetical protein